MFNAAPPIEVSNHVNTTYRPIADAKATTGVVVHTCCTGIRSERRGPSTALGTPRGRSPGSSRTPLRTEEHDDAK